MGLAPNRKSVGWSSTLLGRPSGDLAEFIGARQVSWLAAYRRRRLPGLLKGPVAGKASARRLQSRGRPRISGKAYRVPFSPSGAIEGPCLGFVSQLREGLSNGALTAFACSEAGEPLRPWPRACVGAGSEHRQKTGPDFSGQIFEWFGGRTSRPKPSPELPQRCNLGFRDDGATGPDCVFRLRPTTILAKQRFGESTLHFLLEPGESVLRRRPRRHRLVGNAKFGADPHKAR
jgi:hypothetical protein